MLFSFVEINLAQCTTFVTVSRRTTDKITPAYIPFKYLCYLPRHHTRVHFLP